MNKEKLAEFILALKNVRHGSDGLFDLGLAINESGDKNLEDDLLNELKNSLKIEKIIYNNELSDDAVIDKLVSFLKTDNWILLKMEKDLGSVLLNQLKSLSNTNAFQIFDYEDQAVFSMKIPDNCRIIVLADRNFIEEKITYPHFYSLFGPTLILD